MNDFDSQLSPQPISQARVPILHALVIGIDTYPGVAKLLGAVKDAESMIDYLRSIVQDPRINSLKNDQATRSGIISAIQRLQGDPSIGWFDPIVIYYAGHGCELPSPLAEKGMHDSKTQCLVPWDVKCEEEGKLVAPIPGYVLAALLHGLAQVKGNNITVILDSCYSGNTTRGFRTPYLERDRRVLKAASHLPSATLSTASYRARFLSPNAVPSLSLEQDLGILHDHHPAAVGELSEGSPRAKGASLLKSRPITQLGFCSASLDFRPALRSHVLLAACDHSEVAYESLETNSGCFTEALLEFLRANSSMKLTYKTCFLNFPLLKTPRQQSPVCQGDVDRYFFSPKTRQDHQSFIPLYDTGGGRWMLGAGVAQGVLPNSTYRIYPCETWGGSSIQGVLPQEAYATFTAIPISTNPCLSVCRFSVSPQVAPFSLAGLSRRGQSHFFGVFLTERAKSVLVNEVLQHEHGIHHTSSREGARLVLDVDHDNRLTFEPIHFKFPFGVLPTRVDPDDGIIRRILLSMAQWDWHLSRNPYESSRGKKKLAKLAMYKLDKSGPVRVFNTDDDTEDTVLLSPGEEMYGLEVRSLAKRPLHVYLFYFSTGRQSIRPMFMSVCGSASISAPLSPGKKITIGYGYDDIIPGAMIFRSNLDVGYFRLFVTTCPADFDSITQHSPFPAQLTQAPLHHHDKFGDGLLIGGITRPLPSPRPMLGEPLNEKDAEKALGVADVWDVVQLKVQLEDACPIFLRLAN